MRIAGHELVFWAVDQHGHVVASENPKEMVPQFCFQGRCAYTEAKIPVFGEIFGLGWLKRVPGSNIKPRKRG